MRGLLFALGVAFVDNKQLRHSTIDMTANHFTDPRQRATLPVCNFFSDENPHTKPNAKSQLGQPNPNLEATALKAGVSTRV